MRFTHYLCKYTDLILSTQWQKVYYHKNKLPVEIEEVLWEFKQV